MTLLITGTSSRACSKKREGTLASLISWAMANSDENVTHVFPHAIDEITQPVLIGLSSPTAPVSNYTYHGFATLSDAYDQGMLAGVFIDQPDPNSVANGCRTALSDYARLSSDFYSKRPGHGQYLEDDDFRKKVHRGMSLYLNEQLNLIVPAYPWANEKKIKKLVPEQHRLRLVDPSGAFDSLMSIISQEESSKARIKLFLLSLLSGLGSNKTLRLTEPLGEWWRRTHQPQVGGPRLLLLH